MAKKKRSRTKSNRINPLKWVLPLLTLVVIGILIVRFSINPFPSSEKISNPKEESEIIAISTLWDNGTTTFSNPKIDISIKYPTKMNLYEISEGRFSSRYDESSQYQNLAIIKFLTPKNSADIWLKVINNYKNLPFDEFLRSRAKLGIYDKTPVYEDLNPLKINNQDAYSYKGILEGRLVKIVYLPYMNKVYKFQVFSKGGVPTQEAEDLLDKIIQNIEFKK